MRYARGKKSLAECDRCGLPYDYVSIREEWNGLRVCNSCFDIKHPQLEPVNHRADAISLRHPRPGVAEVVASSADAFGSEPPYDFIGGGALVGSGLVQFEII